MIEEWKFITYFPDILRDRFLISNIGRVWNLLKDQEKKLGNSHNGYLLCSITRRPKTYNARVNRLVAHEFIRPLLPEEEVNHRDGNKHNNCVTNLEIVSHKRNIEHSIQILGHTRKGVSNPNARLTEEQVQVILSSKTPAIILSYDFGVAPGTIYRIRRQKCNLP